MFQNLELLCREHPYFHHKLINLEHQVFVLLLCAQALYHSLHTALQESGQTRKKLHLHTGKQPQGKNSGLSCYPFRLALIFLFFFETPIFSGHFKIKQIHTGLFFFCNFGFHGLLPAEKKKYNSLFLKFCALATLQVFNNSIVSYSCDWMDDHNFLPCMITKIFSARKHIVNRKGLWADFLMDKKIKSEWR